MYRKYRHSSTIFTLACIVWFAWRVGTKPVRIVYPCQRIALLQIALSFSALAAPALVILSKCARFILKSQYLKLAAVALVIISLLGGFTLYRGYREQRLKARFSRTIPPRSPAAARAGTGMVPEGGIPFSELPSRVCPDDPVVSFSHDSSVSYGMNPPYDQADNPAYDFVWNAVERLGLGGHANPLDDLIDSGDTVLIKPNWVEYAPAAYTEAAMVRPLIDMAIGAGATVIYVGDGGEWWNFMTPGDTYYEMVDTLQARNPGITIECVDLHDTGPGWHWIYLGGDSSFAGSGYSSFDLGDVNTDSLAGRGYYSFTDPQGVNPGGEALGWYAINDRVLEADVIINVPKMKSHNLMMATAAVKNPIGCTLQSTSGGGWDGGVRIAHFNQSGRSTYFDNDIFWRAILDLNKVLLYTGADWTIQTAQQREYLGVIDGIVAMERSQHGWDNGTPYDRGVVLASVDPVAVSAVSSRVMGYDYLIIPHLRNAASDALLPIGTDDPENIVIVGEEINAGIDHVFAFNPNWSSYTDALALTDFDPPVINSVEKTGNTVTADIGSGLVTYIFYQDGGTEYIQKMARAGDTYSAAVPGTTENYRLLAQDERFNTVYSPLYQVPTPTPPTPTPTPPPGPTTTPSPSPSPTAVLTPTPHPSPSSVVAFTPTPTITPVESPTPPARHWILDYNGDSTSDVAVFREGSGLWAIRGVSRAYFGGIGDEPVPGDYNGDRTTEIGIFRPSTGLWALRGVSRIYFGSSSDLPQPGDYDGDGTPEVGIFRSVAGLWAIRGVTRAYFGTAGDIPVPGYYSGNGLKAIGIFRPSSGLWAIRGVSRAYFGGANDTPPAGDYNGDGVWEIGLFRPASGLWAIRGVSRAYFGGSADDPVPGDYNGDGADDIGIFRSAAGLWALRGISRVYFGTTGDIPVSR